MSARILVVLVVLAGRASGEPEVEPSAADVEAAPRPGGESGRADSEVGDSGPRRLARAALFGPKLIATVVLSPVRGAIWLDERFALEQLYRRVFFNDAYTIGLYPTVALDSLFGMTLGARFVDRDLLGAHESISLAARAGGEYRTAVTLGAWTGKRLGDHVALGLDASWERRPHDPFYGIGNGELVHAPPVPPPDPRRDPTMLETTYRDEVERAAVTLDVRPTTGLHALVQSAITRLSFGPGDSGLPIDRGYATEGLVGYGGVRHVYEQLELRVDRRRRATVWEPQSIYAEGWLAAGFGGLVHRIDGGYDFWRGGIELQQFVRLGEGPRVLAARFHGEAVSGDRDVVPFAELPALGGGAFLRGYAYQRFRDRVAAVASLEYQWDLGHFVDASLFVDGGRVYRGLHQLELRDLRVGFGTAVRLHSERGFLLELELASSIDGGVFATLAFNRVYDARSTWR